MRNYLRHLRRGDVKDYVDNKYVSRTEELERGHPAAYYRTSHVCGNCFRVYTKVRPPLCCVLLRLCAHSGAFTALWGLRRSRMLDDGRWRSGLPCALALWGLLVSVQRPLVCC